MSTAALSPFTRIGRQGGQGSLPHGSDQSQCNVMILSARRDGVEQIDEWAARQAREMVSSIEARQVSDDIGRRPMSRVARYVVQEKSNWRLEDVVEVPNIRTATLVQMWREIEAEGGLASRRGSGACSVASNSRTGTSVSNNGSLVGEQPTESEDSDFADDQSTDWESAVKTPIAQGVSCGGDNEKGRVADVVRRFTARSPTGNSSVPIDKIDSREQTPRSQENGSSALFDQVMNQGREIVGHPNRGSLNYRRIRDTRAFKDFLIRMEGERLRELAGIGERHAVSQFAYKGRIQSMLRFRTLSREVMIQGQKYPSSSVQLDQLQPGTSVLLLRQKFNTKGKPNTVSNDMPESNSSMKRGGHLENTSFDKLHQNYSRGSKQIVKKGSQQEETMREQDIGLEPQVTPPRSSSDLAIKDEEANTSAGETWRPKSSCNGLSECHGNESTRDNIQESQDSEKILELHSENWQEERPIRASNTAPQQFCTKPSTSGDLKEEVSTKYEAETGQSNWHDDRNFSSHDSLYNLGDKPTTESNQLKEAISQLASSPVKAYIRAHQHSSSKPPTIRVIKEEVSSHYAAEQIEYESRILQSNLHSNTGYSSHDLSGSSEYNISTTSHQPEEAIRTHEFESQVSSCSPPSSIGQDAECNQRSLCIDHVNWNDRSSNTSNIQGWDEDTASEEPEMTQLGGYNYGASLSHPCQQKLRRQGTSDWLERVSENVELLELYERRIVSTVLASEFRDRLEQIIVNILARCGEETIVEANEEHSVCHYCPNNGNLASSKTEQLTVASFRQFHEQDNHSQSDSVEMDLIVELRSDMARIRQEVSDLKRMITSCMDMQLELHHYVKEGVYSPQKCQTEASLTMTQQATRHGNCCVCCELQIDSLLYMCGHMCACLKCAYELQSKSGSCPICRASVIDVVRVYSNS